MSDYTEECGIVVIKEQYDIDFQHIIKGEYDKIKDKYLHDAFMDFIDEDEYKLLSNWSCTGYIDNSKDYKNTYIDGLFSFAVSWNTRGTSNDFYSFIFCDILPIIVARTICHEWWYENDCGDKPLYGKREYMDGWK